MSDIDTLLEEKLNRSSNLFLELDNWQEQAELDKATGRFIAIDNASIINRKNMSGYRSSIFDEQLGLRIGANREKENVICEYTCDETCGLTSGRYREGQICPECGTRVEKRYSADQNIHGWITLPMYNKTGKLYKIITPNAFALIARYFTRDTLIKIIYYSVEMDYGGNITINTRAQKNNPLSKYYNIGIMNFCDKFEDILKVITEKKLKSRTKRKEYAHFTEEEREKHIQIQHDFFVANKDKFFTSFIYLPPPTVRPAVLVDSNKFRYDPMNSTYNAIISAIRTLNNSAVKLNLANKDVEINNCLVTRVILPLNDLRAITPKPGAKKSEEDKRKKSSIIGRLGGKTGRIRGSLYGTRMNFSARVVNVSRVSENYPSLRGISIGIRTFLELYKYEIFAALWRMPRFSLCTTWEIMRFIRNQINSKSDYDKDILDIVNRLVNDHNPGMWTLVNRNPTMDLGSTQMMQIVEVVPDPSYLCIGLPFTSMPSMNADVDGDVLNLMPLYEKNMIREFMALCPDAMINNIRGLHGFDWSFFPGKDQMVSLFRFLRKEKAHVLPDNMYVCNIPQLEDNSMIHELTGKVHEHGGIRVYETKIKE